MILLRLYLEFFRVGLFSVGGGLATIPFLADMGQRTGWFSAGQLADMIAVAESTPGPIGINMATYVGFTSAGLPGGVVATLGIVSPAIIVIFIVAKFLERFRSSRLVDGAFYGLRAASAALVTSALLQVASIAFADQGGGAGVEAVHWPAVALAAAVFALMVFTPAKKLHPVCFIALSAAAGIILRM